MSVWMVETLIATTLLMALVMLLRRPVARWLGAGAAYCLWAVPFARMLLPALPGDGRGDEEMPAELTLPPSPTAISPAIPPLAVPPLAVPAPADSFWSSA